MRIWSLHPRYLDTKGLVALWRETLLARKVLEGRTRGYTKHPQLTRFKEAQNPLDAIDFYLSIVWEEAQSREYHFDRGKFSSPVPTVPKIPLSRGQLEYERQFLQGKLFLRDPSRLSALLAPVEEHPLFILTDGPPAPWERIRTKP